MSLKKEQRLAAALSAGLDGAVTKRRVAVVAVHGMGSQKQAETLLEWAEPLLRRLEWIAMNSAPSLESNALAVKRSGGVPQASVAPRSPLRFETVQLSDGAHDEVRATLSYRDGERKPVELELRVTEARWAEAFIGMSQGDVFTWGAGFVWRTVARLGSHFTRTIWLAVWRVLGVFSFATAKTGRWWRYPLGGLALAVVVLFFCAPLIAVLWPFLIAVAIVITLMLPVAGLLLFLPVFKNALQSVINSLVEFVGDVGTWTRRPVRAAAMRGVVRAQLVSARAWLDEKPPQSVRELVVVAHSQGSVIAAQTLFDDQLGEPPTPVDAFVSVGSAITLLGSSRWDSGILQRFRKFIAGVGVDEPTFDPVDRWRHTPARWYNMWGIWDPFAAGPISTSTRHRAARWRLSYRTRLHRGTERPLALSTPTTRAAATLAPYVDDAAYGPREYPVHNTASPLTDHGAYSPNIVQVIDPIARLIMNLEVPIEPSQATGAAQRELRRTLEHVRSVRELGMQRLLALGLAGALLLTPLSQGLVSTIKSLVLQAFGNPSDGVVVWLLSLGWFPRLALGIAVAAFALWLNVRLWRSYISRVSWERTDRRRYWLAGLMFRVALATAMTWVFWVYLPQLLGDPLDLALRILIGLIGLAAIIVPSVGLLPLPVEAAR